MEEQAVYSHKVVVFPGDTREMVLEFLRNHFNAIKWSIGQNYGVQVKPDVMTNEYLLSTPIAESLSHIANAALGQYTRDEAHLGIVKEHIQDFWVTLFSIPNVYAEVPKSFRMTLVGNLVDRAQLWLEGDEAITIKDAANILSVTTQTISQRADRDTLRIVAYNAESEGPYRGRRLLSKAEVLELKAKLEERSA